MCEKTAQQSTRATTVNKYSNDLSFNQLQINDHIIHYIIILSIYTGAYVNTWKHSLQNNP